MPEKAKIYFRKEIFSNAFYVRGKAAPFEDIGNNQGLLVLDYSADADLIAALSQAAEAHRGGIVKISEAEYAEKKSRASLIPPRKRLPQHETLKVAPSPFSPRLQSAKAVEPVASEGLKPAEQMAQAINTVNGQEAAPPAPGEKPAETTTFKPATAKVKVESKP